MKNSLARLLVLLSVVFLLVSCATSPTGRRQFLVNDEAQMAEMGRAAFAEIQSTTQVIANSPDTTYVRCVANAITSVLTPEELGPVAVDRWEVQLFDDASANAFALPGGKIGVHTGLLDVARTQSQLAAVLGHEVGHVLARHSNERVSQQYGADALLNVGSIFLGAETAAQQQMLGLLGVGVQYGILMPYGRTQESEADEIGLELMARAGFDPSESITLWQNMAAAGGGVAPPEFMSTHPSHSTRIAQLQSWQSKVMPLYEQARAAGRRPNCR